VELEETHSEETLRVLEGYSDELAGFHLYIDVSVDSVVVCAVDKLFFNRISFVDLSRQHTVQLLTNGFIRFLKYFSKFPASCYDFVRGRAILRLASYTSSTLY
jgi:hypothetical protein